VDVQGLEAVPQVCGVDAAATPSQSRASHPYVDGDRSSLGPELRRGLAAIPLSSDAARPLAIQHSKKSKLSKTKLTPEFGPSLVVLAGDQGAHTWGNVVQVGPLCVLSLAWFGHLR
jgi:hypothetical protein